MAKQKNAQVLCGEIISELKKKIYKPVYFLAGDEAYYIDLVADYIGDNVLSETERAFNQIIMYGKDTSITSIIEASRRFPMMSNHQVIIVREAQHIKNIEDIQIYLKSPLNSTVLVICLKLAPGVKLSAGAKKAFDLAAKIGLAMESKRLYDNQIPTWINGYLARKGIEVTPVASELLNDHLGNDLSKIANELEKLIIMLPPNTKKITPEHIEQNIGISKDYNRFELAKAVGVRDILKANRIADYLSRNPSNNRLPDTIIALYTQFNRIFTYHFLKDSPENIIATKLGISPFFLSEYKRAAKIYSTVKCVQIFAMLR